MTPLELKAFRDQSGLTQQALADKLGVHVRTVRRWEALDGYKSFDKIVFGPPDKVADEIMKLGATKPK